MRKSGDGERWREGAADRKLRKERTERVAQQYCNCIRPAPLSSMEQVGREHDRCTKSDTILIASVHPPSGHINSVESSHLASRKPVM